jgi:hypothetical protein
LILGEALDVQTIVGGTLVIAAGVLVVALEPADTPPSEAAPPAPG